VTACIGLMGFGRFGEALASLALDAGMEVRAYDSGVAVPAELAVPTPEALSAACDALILAVPIAAIPGICTGGAAVIAAACDLRLATRQLKYGFPIARTLANCLSAANIARVALLTGVGRALDLLLTTRLIGADEALAIGLVNELVDTPEALLQRAWALGAQISTQAPLTMLAGKEVVRRMRANFAAIDDSDLLALCYGSADFREGLRAFLAKRPPKFTAQ